MKLRVIKFCTGGEYGVIYGNQSVPVTRSACKMLVNFRDVQFACNAACGRMWKLGTRAKLALAVSGNYMLCAVLPSRQNIVTSQVIYWYSGFVFCITAC